MTMTGIAKDTTNPQVITVLDTIALREVAEILVEEGIIGAPAVNDLGDLLGVVS
jgi:CBS domain-containing protein